MKETGRDFAQVQLQDHAPGTLIPPGTFYASGDDELTRERVLAIQFVEKFGQILIDKHGREVIEMYRDPMKTGLEIALAIFPQEARRYPVVMRTAVSWALRRLLPQEEINALTTQHRREQLIARIDFNSPEFLDQCKKAAERRHEMHGVDVEAMLRGRGRTAWTEAEKLMLIDLLYSADFKTVRGAPDYNKIAGKLNELFHDGKNIRNRSTTVAQAADLRRSK